MAGMAQFLATYVSDGRYVPYTPSVDLPPGTVVVQGELVGVTREPLRANRLGNLCVDGVISFPKATTPGSGFGARGEGYRGPRLREQGRSAAHRGSSRGESLPRADRPRRRHRSASM